MTDYKAITKDGVKSVIAQAFAKVNCGEIDTATYEAVLDVLCNTHGTEYVAECFVELTQAGKL